MNNQTLRDYKRFRNDAFLVGCNADDSLRAAKTLEAWRQLEADNRVRIRTEDEREHYLDVYGNPEGYINSRGHKVTPEQERASIIETINLFGCVCVVVEYANESCDCWDTRNCNCKEWHHADSIGMCIYKDATDPFENPYVIQLMQEAIDNVTEH